MVDFNVGEMGGMIMAGLAIFLLSFFAACWVYVVGDLLGWGALEYEVMRASLPIAYTGAIISVGVLAVAVTAVVLRR